MRKVISYRQKIIELARIYKIEKVLDTNLKLTTYEIELELLKNKVPIPSRRGYFSHKIINEILPPLYVFLENLTFEFDFINKFIKKPLSKIKNPLKVILSTNFAIKKVLIKTKNKSLNKILIALKVPIVSLSSILIIFLKFLLKL